jgi:hypothetical protein
MKKKNCNNYTQILAATVQHLVTQVMRHLGLFVCLFVCAHMHVWTILVIQSVILNFLSANDVFMCALDTGAIPVDTLEDSVSYASSVYNMHGARNGKPKSKPVIPSTSGLGSFHSNIKNDGVTGEFDGNDYPHSREMLKVCVGSFYL